MQNAECREEVTTTRHTERERIEIRDTTDAGLLVGAHCDRRAREERKERKERKEERNCQG